MKINQIRQIIEGTTGKQKTLVLPRYISNLFEKRSIEKKISIVLSLTSFIYMVYYCFVFYMQIFGKLSIFCFLMMAGAIFWNFELLSTIFRYKQMNEQAQLQVKLQMRYNNILMENQRETDLLWHDMTKHITLMKSLLSGGQPTLTSEYIEAMEDQMSKSTSIIRTKSPVLNVLLTEQKHRAKKMGIQYDISIHLERQVKIGPMDLCIILGNLFDNALEASLLLSTDETKIIFLSILQRNNAIIIQFENTYCLDIKPDRPGKHGLGLKNVQRTVKKYSGTMSISEENNTYTVSILIP